MKTYENRFVSSYFHVISCHFRGLKVEVDFDDMDFFPPVEISYPAVFSPDSPSAFRRAVRPNGRERLAQMIHRFAESQSSDGAESLSRTAFEAF